MAHPQDRAWGAGLPGRTADDKADKLAEEKPSLSDRVMDRMERIQERKMEYDMVSNIMSGNKGNGGDSLPMKAAHDALEMQMDTIKTLEESRKATYDGLLKAETAKNDAMAALYSNQLNNIREAEARVAEASRERPQSAIETYKEVHTFIRDLMNEMRENQPKETVKPASEVRNYDLEIRVLEMQQNHEMAMKKYDIELARIQNDTKLQLLQFEEEQKRRWREYEDNRARQETAFDGIMDLAGSLGAGISAARKGYPPGVGQPVPEPDDVVTASIKTFPCKFCGSKVKIEPGKATAVCPGENCQAEYDIMVGKGA